jgi:hypothetical protein
MSTQYKEFIVQPGEYTAKVFKAEWVQSQYRERDDNPDGDSLSLWMDLELPDSKYKRLFDTISITDLLKINQARVSAGLKPYKQSKNILEKNVEDMEGQRIVLLVDKYNSKAGKTSNIVRSYIEQNNISDTANEKSDERIPF